MARRYAAALFDVALKTGHADRAGDELIAIARIVGGHAELRTLLATPAVPAATKKDIMTAVIETGGGVSAEVLRLVAMLAERDRLGVLPELQRAYADRLLEYRKVVPAEVVTASPLTDGSRAALTAALGAATGSQVTLNERVDPAIVGGIIARVGSMVFDGSVTRQLERIRQNLEAEA